MRVKQHYRSLTFQNNYPDKSVCLPATLITESCFLCSTNIGHLKPLFQIVFMNPSSSENTFLSIPWSRDLEILNSLCISSTKSNNLLTCWSLWKVLIRKGIEPNSQCWSYGTLGQARKQEYRTTCYEPLIHAVLDLWEFFKKYFLSQPLLKPGNSAHSS